MMVGSQKGLAQMVEWRSEVFLLQIPPDVSFSPDGFGTRSWPGRSWWLWWWGGWWWWWWGGGWWWWWFDDEEDLGFCQFQLCRELGSFCNWQILLLLIFLLQAVQLLGCERGSRLPEIFQNHNNHHHVIIIIIIIIIIFTVYSARCVPVWFMFPQRTTQRCWRRWGSQSHIWGKGSFNTVRSKVWWKLC